jgi:hypothetical protein
MREANPLWGAPRIHGELQKLGIEVSQATVAKYLLRRRGPPSQSWRTFLTNHVPQLASIDFFTVPTATFRVLFVFVVLSHDRRRIVHVNVTAYPTAAGLRNSSARRGHGIPRRASSSGIVTGSMNRTPGVLCSRWVSRKCSRRLVLPGRIRS